MEINILKEKENVFFTVDGTENQLMNFDNLVALSEKIVNIKDDFEYQINCTDSSLELYKSTLEELIKSLRNDTDLLELLSQKKMSLAKLNLILKSIWYSAEPLFITFL